MATQSKLIRKSNLYKYVQLYHTKEGLERWHAVVGNVRSIHDTEKKAVMQVDKWLIEHNKKPVNILKPVQI